MQIDSYYSNLASWQTLFPQQIDPNAMEAKAVRDAVNAVNQSELLGFDRELRYARDAQTRLPIVQVLNRGTGEVILQIPSELILSLVEMLQNRN